jgi:large subunit ribosomal protein L25
MKKQQMDVMERNQTKSLGSRKVRQAGKIPAVVYGPDFEPLHVSVENKVFMTISKTLSTTVPIQLNIQKLDGSQSTTPAYLKQVQRHKVTDAVSHIDFFVASATHVMHVAIPIRYEHTPAGVKKGGIAEHHYDSILVEALPKDIPADIVVDLTDLELGESITVADLNLPETVKPMMNLDDILISISVPRGLSEEEEAAEVEEGGEAEPEVITAKKPQEE